MLTIRKAQIDAMMQGKKLAAVTTIAEKLKEKHYFFQYYTDEQLQDWINRQIEYLASLKITEKINVEDVIDVIAQHGENFERCSDPSWALDILEDKQENQSTRTIMLQRANKAYAENNN